MLITAGEIARRLGISATRVHQLRLSDPSFPAPAQDSPLGRLYNETTMRRWAKRTGRAWNE